MTKLEQGIASAVATQYSTRDVRILANAIYADLMAGPHSDYPEGVTGFVDATAKLSAWSDENLPSEVWFDTQAEQLLENEPQGYEDEEGEYQEPMWEDYMKLTRRDLERFLFGKTTAEYL